jgi:elongation factor Ts
MGISAKQVKELRDKTGAGMMDCKKALVETDGDIDAAIEYLQKKGIMKAAKKASRVAAEGLVATRVSDDGTSAVVLEINCETDFVARNDQFQEFVDDVATVLANSDAETVDQAQQLDFDGKTLEEATKEAIATIGENIQLRRFARFSQPEGFVASYVHAGSQIGVLVGLRVDGSVSDEQEEFGRDVAMHVAAMNPGYLSTDQVDEDAAAKQEEIFRAQIADEGKPEHIVPKIVQGKMAKWKKERALLEQPFVKNPDLSVKKHQEEVGGVQIVDFIRYEVGEGIEKEEANLAEEVAALKGDD